MDSDVIVFECDLTAKSKDIENDFLISDLTRLISATAECAESYYFSRHVNRATGMSQIFFVTKTKPSRSAQLWKAGDEFLKACRQSGKIKDYKIRSETESGALDCVEGLPDHAGYESFWRFAQAGSDAALEILKNDAAAEGHVCFAGKGTDIKSGIAHHWAHFFWNALGIQEYTV